MRTSIIVLALVVAVGVFTITTQAAGPAEAACSTSETWQTSVPSRLAREFTIEFCGADDLDLELSASWKGHKDVLVSVIEPDGTVHQLDSGRGVAATIEGPLDQGDWTIRVWNLSRGSAKVTLSASFGN